MPYPSYINYIASNERVLSSVTNRPTTELALRTDELKSRLDAAELSQALMLYDAPMSSDTVVGTPVYWNATNKQFEPAYANAELNTDYNDYVKSECANCIGLVYKKESSVSGHIVLSGVVNLTGISSVLLDTGDGRIYLSSEPGKLTHKILSICVPVGTILGAYSECDSYYRVYVNPALNDLWSHLHYCIDLKPALVTSDTEEGWLQVLDDDTTAPAGAVYKYNISKNVQLESLFPPIPLDACALQIDWNDLDETVGSKDIPVNTKNSLVKVTTRGIFWMDSVIKPFAPSTSFVVTIDDAEEGATWTAGDSVAIGTYTYTITENKTNKEIVADIITDITTNKSGKVDGWTVYATASTTDSKIAFYRAGYYTTYLDVSVNTANDSKTISIDENFRTMRERFIMSKVQFSNRANCVTSLQPDNNQPFKFVDKYGNEAYAGDLYAQFTLKDTKVKGTTYDGKVVREFNDNWEQELIPAINGVAVTGNALSISSSTDSFDYLGVTYHNGLVTLQSQPLNDTEITPQIMKLGDAIEREYNGILYLAFPLGHASSILSKFEIPATFTGNMLFKTLFYSGTAGTFPAITCEYKKIAYPTTGSLDVSTLSYTTLPWTTAIVTGSNTVFSISTPTIAVNGGDTIIVKLSRAATNVGCADAGIVRFDGVLKV